MTVKLGDHGDLTQRPLASGKSLVKQYRAALLNAVAQEVERIAREPIPLTPASPSVMRDHVCAQVLLSLQRLGGS